MAFYELRQYKIKPGKMSEWLEFMENKIIPFQVSKGAVISASFKGETDDTVYFWIRRFESETERERLYKDIYESDYWKDEVAPKVGELIDREAIQVQRVTPTSLSILRYTLCRELNPPLVIGKRAFGSHKLFLET